MMIPIRAERKARGWTVVTMAKKLRAAADDPRDVPADLENIRQNIHRWERGGSAVSERYRYLYCRAFGCTEFELFGIESPEIITKVHGITPPADGISVSGITADDASGNQYVVLVLPRGPQRVVIDITSAEAGQEIDVISQPISRLTLVREPSN